jgi:hypothetical protein
VNRTGAALVVALLVLLVLEGVVLGAVYLTVQERRIADNGVTTLRLRLAGEAAARAAAATWPPGLDSLAAGELSRETVALGTDGLVMRTRYQRIDDALVLVFAEAAEPPPRAGRARAALLIEPPLLPERLLPLAALAAGAGVALGSRALVAATAGASCADDPADSPDAVRLPSAGALQREPGATLEGPTRTVALEAWWSGVIAGARAALPAVADTTAPGVIAVVGDLTVPRDAVIRGVVLVDGALVLGAGAVIEGVVVATGPIEVQGTIRFSSCAARTAIRAAGLHRPRVYALRPSVPAF